VELYRLIIGHLHDDKATLKACSLTCKTFLHLSWYHLFYQISLHERDLDTERFGIIGSTHSSTSPCTYVRTLFLIESGWISNLLTTRLPNVTTLTLLFSWNELDNTQRAMMLSGFQKVTYLDISDSWFDTSAEMTELIASFPLLEHLCCFGMICWEYAEPVIPLPHGINKITLSADHSTFFDKLLRLEPHPDVRAIKLYNDEYTMDYTKKANKLLKTLGSRLEDLELGEIS
jgi:hypothetical protein